MTKYFQINCCLWDCDLNRNIDVSIHRFLLTRASQCTDLFHRCVKSTILHYEVQPLLFNVLFINKLSVALNTDGSWRTFTAIWDEYCFIGFISLQCCHGNIDSWKVCYVWLLQCLHIHVTPENLQCLIFSSTVFLQLVQLWDYVWFRNKYEQTVWTINLTVFAECLRLHMLQTLAHCVIT